MDLNKKSVKQQGGSMIPNQGGMQQQQQADPQIMQITEVFSSSMEEGKQPQEIVMGLLEQEVDQNLIGQALMTMGYEEEVVMQLFEEIQKMQEPQFPSPQQITNNPQQLSRADQMQQEAPAMDMNISSIDQAKSGIEIKPENEGKFTAWAKARGMSVKEAYSKVMANTDRFPPSIVDMANFAKNAAGWKKQVGGAVIQQQLEDPSMYRTITPERQFEQDYINYTEKNGPISIQDYSKLTGMDASMYKTLTPERQLENDIIKKQGGETAYLANRDRVIKREMAKAQSGSMKEGGEFEAHFMYKGDRKIRAKDMATHLRLMEAGYGPDAPKAQTGGENKYSVPLNNEIPGSYFQAAAGLETKPNPNTQAYGNDMQNQMSQFLTNAQSSTNAQGSNIEKGKTSGNFVDRTISSSQDEGILQPGPLYINPAIFNNNDFNLGKAANVALEAYDSMFSSKDKNEDGLSDGSFRDWQGKKERNKINSIQSAKYTFDNSEDNMNAIEDWYTQYKIENPKAQFGREFTNSMASLNQYLKSPEFRQQFGQADNSNMFKPITRGQEASGDPGDVTQDPFSAMNQPSNVQQPGPTAAELKKNINPGTLDVDFGGLNGFIDRTLNSNVAKVAGNIANTAYGTADVLNDWYDGKNKSDAYEDLRGSTIAENVYGTKTDAYNKLGSFDVQGRGMGSDGQRVAQTGGSLVAGTTPAKAGLGRLLKEGIEQLPGALRKLKTFFGSSDKANPYVSFKGFGADDIPQNGPNAFNDYMNSFAMIDPAILATIAGLPFLENYRGDYFEKRKEKRKFDNEHRKSRGMTSDGATWRNQQGGEQNGYGLELAQTGGNLASIGLSEFIPPDFMKRILNVPDKSAYEIEELYNDALDITDVSEGLDFFNNVKKRDIKKWLSQSGIGKQEVRDYVQEQPFYQDANFFTRGAIKAAMKYKGLKRGGEIMELSEDMIAQLTAAGADIEII